MFFDYRFAGIQVVVTKLNCIKPASTFSCMKETVHQFFLFVHGLDNFVGD